MATIGFQSRFGNYRKYKARLVAAALRKVAEEWAKILRKNAPYDRHKNPGPETRKTGEHLKDSIFVRTSGTSVEVVSDRKYLAYVLAGTKKHRIPAEGKFVHFYWPLATSLAGQDETLEKHALWRYKGKKGKRKVLRFPSGVVTLDHVNHPGAKANNFVKRHLPELRKMLQAELRRKK